jgi:hypothetical protein
MQKVKNESPKFIHTYMPEKQAFKIAGIIESLLDDVQVDMGKYNEDFD